VSRDRPGRWCSSTAQSSAVAGAETESAVVPASQSMISSARGSPTTSNQRSTRSAATTEACCAGPLDHWARRRKPYWPTAAAVVRPPSSPRSHASPYRAPKTAAMPRVEARIATPSRHPDAPLFRRLLPKMTQTSFRGESNYGRLAAIFRSQSFSVREG
jgi:hypothetical protein